MRLVAAALLGIGLSVWATPVRAFDGAIGAVPQAASQDVSQTAPPTAPSSAGQADHPDGTPPAAILRNDYFGLQGGFITYPFSAAQLQPGFHAPAVVVPHLAVGAVLVGHEFNQYLSFQVGVFRPARWVEYRDVNGDQAGHSVWMNIWGLTMKSSVPISRQWSAFGAGGLAIVSRKGFLIDQVPVVRDASYATLLVGAGLEYHVNDNWTVQGALTAVPGRVADAQPHTVLVSGGFDYTSRGRAEEPDTVDGDRTLIWPRRIWRVGFITNGWGYGVNTALTKKVPVFWPGEVAVANGVSASYEGMLLHTRRLLALDWGASVSTWKSNVRGDRFVTAAVFPAIRISLVRTAPVDCYFSYSIAGPALITRTTIDDQAVGRHFTFQDYMGIGFFLGAQRKVTAELRIEHFSNGGLFPTNPGVTIPLGFYFGTSF